MKAAGFLTAAYVPETRRGGPEPRKKLPKFTNAEEYME